MKIRIIIASKLKDKNYLNIIDEFVKRLSPYLKVEIIDFKINDKLEVEKALDIEAEKLLKLSENYFRVILDPKGKHLSTMEFTKWFSENKNNNKDIAFLIGSAYGLSDKIKSKANKIISLSDMTMAHKIALIVLVEQIYRTITIINGHPYHK